ncbi:hypothetical protein NS2R_10705 [Pseudomonas oryzihabitans]|nr:hypothetical protein NS2R_10705 [Pseudomonas psychrotolerans]
MIECFNYLLFKQCAILAVDGDLGSIVYCLPSRNYLFYTCYSRRFTRPCQPPSPQRQSNLGTRHNHMRQVIEYGRSLARVRARIEGGQDSLTLPRHVVSHSSTTGLVSCPNLHRTYSA